MDLMEPRSATNSEPQASRAVAQAREALDTGRPALARDVLVDHVSTTYDRQALGLLGQVLFDLEDLSGAGAAWFGTTARGRQVDEATAAWRQSHHDDFGALWRSLPKPVRIGPRLPKVEALRVKAFPGVAARPDREESPTTDPREAEPATSRAKASTAASSRSGATGSTSRPVVTPPSQPAGPPVAVTPKETASRPEPTPQPDTAPTPEGRQPIEHNPRPAASERPEGERRAAVSRSSHRAPEPVRKVEPARLISWVLAALFVFCAVVGAITILGWLIPG